MSVEVEGDILIEVERISLSSYLFLKGAAVGYQSDLCSRVRSEVAYSVYKGDVILIIGHIMSYIAGIEAVDIYRALSGLAGGNGAAEGIAAGGGYAGHIPCYGIVVGLVYAHIGVCGSGAGITHVLRRVALSRDTICLAVYLDSFRKGAARIGLINGILLFVENEIGDVLVRSTCDINR